MVWPPIRYAYNTVVTGLRDPAPSPPDSNNLLGTDDQARDVLAAHRRNGLVLQRMIDLEPWTTIVLRKRG